MKLSVKRGAGTEWQGEAQEQDCSGAGANLKMGDPRPLKR